MYDHIFTPKVGYSSTITYYARLANRFTGQLWDVAAGAMADSPTAANSKIAVTSLNGGTRMGFTLPSTVPAGEYQILLYSHTAGGDPALTDDLVANPVNLQKSPTGRVVVVA